MTGTVFDIQRAALHDGPGIRTTVFLNGCPLRCAWCHNPEAFTTSPPTGYSGQTYGRVMSVEQIMSVVEADRGYYRASGGGLTVSGGEPTGQYAFCVALLTAAKRAGIHTCLDTSGHLPTDALLQVAHLVDLFHFDVKLPAGDQHTRWTGVDGRLIYRNLIALRDRGCRIHLRCPIVPGVNDTPEHHRYLDQLFASGGFESVEHLPYHGDAAGKYRDLGLPPPQFPPSVV